MSVSLEECRLRCEWALKHLKTLNEANKGFLGSNPYRLLENLDRQSGEYSIRIKAKPLPDDLSFLIGDVLHNLRSSLDHLVWELTIANGNTPPSFPLPRKHPWRDIQFPIFLTEHQFKSRRFDPLWGISSESKAFIKELQPFNTGEDPKASSLWILQELSNIDKHRVPHVAVSYLRYLKVISGSLNAGKIKLRRAPQVMEVPGVFEEDTKVLSMIFDLLPEMKMDMQAEIEVDIAFDERSGVVKGLPVVETLTDMGAWVWEIFRRAKELPGVRG